MSEFTEDQKASLEYKFYDRNLTLLVEINDRLNSIKNWVTYFGVLSVIGLIVWFFVLILSFSGF